MAKSLGAAVIGAAGTAANDINGKAITVPTSGVKQVYAGREAARLIGVPYLDPRVPDVIGIAEHGVVYTGGKGKIAEHGGNDLPDRNVPVLVLRGLRGSLTIQHSIVGAISVQHAPGQEAAIERKGEPPRFEITDRVLDPGVALADHPAGLLGDGCTTVDRIQPLIFAVQVGLAAVWRASCNLRSATPARATSSFHSR